MQKVKNPLFRIVLIEPEIPNNTGNIGRTCVGLNSELHLVGKLGFEISDKQLKRAGLDYWPHLKWTHHQSFDDWWSHVENPKRVFFFSTKSQKTHFDIEFQEGDWLVFGRETAGLSPEILARFPCQMAKIPQIGPIRSLNLATAVAIVAYEGYRQMMTGSAEGNTLNK